MKIVSLIAACILLAVEVHSSYLKEVHQPMLSAFNYHTKYGIPKAIKIKELEDSLENSAFTNERIVGGTVTDIAKVPYQAGLLIRIFDTLLSFCGGTLISTTNIVTAAHCYTDGNLTADDFIAVLGSNRLFSGGVRIVTNDVSIHPSYNPDTIVNDISVLKIAPIILTPLIQPASLPTTAAELSLNFAGFIGFASGYGLTKDNGTVATSQSLYSVQLDIISNTDCRTVYGDIIFDSTICTSGTDGKGTCNGDSGGPLVVNSDNQNVLVGVTSFGAEECELDYPSAYTRVTSYISWIQSVM